MQTPAFIFGLLDAELRRVHVELLKNVATKYKLDHDSLVQEFLPQEKLDKLVDKRTTTTEVYVKHKKVAHPPPESRCMARIYNRGKGGQCTKSRSESGDLCALHCKYLKHGKITDPVPRELFPFHASAIYK